jgi:polyphosphate kinase
MVRNLDKRVEVATPIYDIHLQQELKEYMRLQLNDNRKARIIDKHQSNCYKSRGETSYRAQEDIYRFLENGLLDQELM